MTYPTHLIPTTVVDSYKQPDWLVDALTRRLHHKSERRAEKRSAFRHSRRNREPSLGGKSGDPAVLAGAAVLRVVADVPAGTKKIGGMRYAFPPYVRSPPSTDIQTERNMVLGLFLTSASVCTMWQLPALPRQRASIPAAWARRCIFLGDNSDNSGGEASWRGGGAALRRCSAPVFSQY